jgi:hypothetical protein
MYERDESELNEKQCGPSTRTQLIVVILPFGYFAFPLVSFPCTIQGNL